MRKAQTQAQPQPQAKKRRKKISAALLAALLLFLSGATALAAEAVTESTPKEEVVYVNLSEDGSVDAIYVVNIFELTEGGQVVDYGDYTALRNLTSSEEILFDSQKVTIDTNQRKLYYEGTLNSSVIPWNFDIRYYMDGKRYSPREMAGRDGELEIAMDVTAHPGDAAGFFDNYALQATFTLDAKNCTNIEAEGATIANGGANKQISYTILPGKGAEIRISATTKNFELPPITINGIALNMEVEMDEEAEEELRDQAKDITKAATEFDDGAAELLDGATELSDGVEELQEGVEEMADGVTELTDKTGEMLDGVNELAEGVEEFHSKMPDLSDGAEDLTEGISDLTEGARSIKSGLHKLDANGRNLVAGSYEIVNQLVSQIEDQLNAQLGANTSMAAITLTLNNYETVLDGLLMALGGGAYSEEEAAALTQSYQYQSIAKLKDQMKKLADFYYGMVDYTEGVSKLAEGARELHNGSVELYDGAAEFRDGILELKDGSAEILDAVWEFQDGTLKLQDGVIELKDGVLELLDGIIEVYDGTVEFKDGIIELKDGTFEFKDKTAHMGDDLVSSIKDAISHMLGGDFQPVSFVSEKNTSVNSVLFVMQTPEIAIPETEIPEEEEVQLTFFQKLLNLFRFE